MNNSLVTTQIQQIAGVLGITNVDPAELKKNLVQTVFKGADDAQLSALLIVANQYNLNPFTKEIYAFPAKGGGIVPLVSIDGWNRIINSNESFDGIEFDEHDDRCTCIIYRKDRTHPTKVTEFLSECQMSTDPWKKYPKRMLRHKALIQCARIAFGFAGIYDEDEAQRIEASENIRTVTEDLPEGYADYEAEQLQLMREQSMLGTDALANAYKGLQPGALKNTFWARHSASLKQAAQQADISAKGEIYEHPPA